MIRYIFKDKRKNILMIVLAILNVIFSNFFTEIYSCITVGVLPAGYEIFPIIPYVLILIYLLTLKNKYKFKTWLFPAAFAFWAGYNGYSLVNDIFLTLSIYEHFVFIEILSYISYLLAIVAYVFCIFGSIYNFKNVKLLKIGAIIKIAGYVIITIITSTIEYIALGGKEYFENIPKEYLNQVYSSMCYAVIEWLVSTMFFVGILLLTLNKKSEDIDITPFVEQQRNKKEAKKAAKLQQKEAEEARFNEPLPETPEGSWRCRACGKILPDSKDRCECGYKK